ncbi:hypothetical protein V5N11_021787 [Cardamine amara subsp. amara]|uniref:Uncharacterized protein n=1 Tax=Cardamine amara subsp. amara TaxID=228776 RepID=A0ABD1BGI1_CARAN
MQVPKISVGDTLFGVLTEDDVGIDVVTGRPKIAKDVLDVMRDYFSVDDPSQKKIRIERVRRSVWDLEDDPHGKKTLLRLEPATKVTSNLNKGKGLVYDFEGQKLLMVKLLPRSGKWVSKDT